MPIHEVFHEALDTLPISDQQWVGLLDELTHRAQQSTASESGRQHDRIATPFDAGMTLVRLIHANGRTDTFKVRLRNISQSGIGFVHGLTLPKNTPCLVMILNQEGHAVLISSTIVRCQPVKKIALKAFEVGIKFDRHIDPNDFVAPEEQTPQE